MKNHGGVCAIMAQMATRVAYYVVQSSDMYAGHDNILYFMCKEKCNSEALFSFVCNSHVNN